MSQRPDDVIIENHGSVLVFQPLTADAREWLDEHISDEALWWAGGLVVEPRYAGPLAEAMIEGGLEVRL